MEPMLQAGIIRQQSNHSVDETVQKLRELIDAKGIKLFALIDHSGEAERAGLHMNPTKLLIFGNPKGGTPLMVAAPSTAIDLPLKILVSEDDDGTVWIYANGPEFLQQRHGFPAELMQNIGVVQKLVDAVAQT